MMTIKAFASLCGCNTQTLRYYDKVNLLKPIEVDPWSGYRYYSKMQSIDFIKIKNLQAADFTIDQIKELLTMSDRQVYEAFEQKIAAQTRKLERIKEIQQSYLKEKTSMERLIQSVSGYLLHAVQNYEVLREFGLSPEDGPTVIAKLKDYIEHSFREDLPAEPEVEMILNDRVIRGADHVAEAFETLKGKGYEDTVLLGDKDVASVEPLTPENSESIWTADGWNFVHEFIKEIPKLEEGYGYGFYFRLTGEKQPEGLEFPLFMIAAMLPKLDSPEISVGCSMEKSEDGVNHFTLLRRKKKDRSKVCMMLE